MKQLEENVIHSFKLAKRDIITLQNEVIRLSQMMEKLRSDVGTTKLAQEKLRKPKQKVIVKKVSAKRAKKHYFASKTGTKFHDPHCPFAKNIKPKMRVRFAAKDTARNKGYKPCNCVR
tara:strand:+ start:1031 stop:1384 length:354 start_codon:yes stop_codon:yes gene_type:complete